MINLNDELAQDYLADCREHLASIEADLLALAKGGTPIDEDRFSRVSKKVHFIWDGAALFDLVKIRELAHIMEQTLNLLHSQGEAITARQVNSLISATDKLNELILRPGASNQVSIAEITNDLSKLRVNDRFSTESEKPIAFVEPRKAAKPLRILLAEDDFACRLLLQTFLSRYGECHAAVNGREAVEAFRISMEQEQPYDLICMDIMMPEMDGREAVQRIRAIEEAYRILSTSGVKVIMTTTVEDVKEVILCFRELCDAYLMKPIDLAELARQMKHYRLIE